jgi:hypothetical protein
MLLLLIDGIINAEHNCGEEIMANTYEALVMTSVGQTKATVQADSTFQAKALLEQMYGKSNLLSVPINVQ